jgi:SAM-dependent methyltransferase
MLAHHRLVGDMYSAAEYSSWSFDHEVIRLEQRSPVEYAITRRYLDRLIQPESTVADVGVGVGHYSEHLARRGCCVHLIDVSQRLLDAAVNRLEAAGLSDRIRGAHCASATDLRMLADGCCDAVLLLGPLYHLSLASERARAIAEAARILRPGGLILAAGINRLIFMGDALRNSPNGTVYPLARLQRFLDDGYLDSVDARLTAAAYLTTAHDFQAELNGVFAPVLFTGTESFASRLPEQFLAASPENQEIWLDLVERTGTTPEGIGAAAHFLYAGRNGR